MIVDDGGDATIYLIEGLAIENKFLATEQLIEPVRGASEDEYWLYKTINKYLQQDKHYFSKLSKNLKGVSEETTTGVSRLYKLEK